MTSCVSLSTSFITGRFGVPVKGECQFAAGSENLRFVHRGDGVDQLLLFRPLLGCQRGDHSRGSQFRDVVDSSYFHGLASFRGLLDSQ